MDVDRESLCSPSCSRLCCRSTPWSDSMRTSSRRSSGQCNGPKHLDGLDLMFCQMSEGGQAGSLRFHTLLNILPWEYLLALLSVLCCGSYTPNLTAHNPSVRPNHHLWLTWGSGRTCALIRTRGLQTGEGRFPVAARLELLTLHQCVYWWFSSGKCELVSYLLKQSVPHGVYYI